MFYSHIDESVGVFLYRLEKNTQNSQRRTDLYHKTFSDMIANIQFNVHTTFILLIIFPMTNDDEIHLRWVGYQFRSEFISFN